MKAILILILRVLSKLTLVRYRPKIVAITGSVGKTSTKEAIALALARKFKIRTSRGNYNNELGVPLAILDEKSGNKNILKWSGIFIKGLKNLFYHNYPQILVLEFGSDKPGDIKYLVDLVGKIDAAVVTDIGISHLEFFSSVQNLAKEKLSLIKNLPQQSAAVLNFDSPKVFDGRKQTKAKVIGYGTSLGAEILATDRKLSKSDGNFGTSFKIHHKGTVVPFFIQAVGKPAVSASMAAVGVGLEFGMNLVEISEALKNFKSPAGRLRIFAGANNSLVIDDTYNAAPASTIAALDALGEIASGRKLVAIGAMKELGEKTESGHREVGMKIVEAGISEVFLVGKETDFIAEELGLRKFSGKVFKFETSDQAKGEIKNHLQSGDTILIKGSQAARMEKIVKELLAQPEKAKESLVRQGEKWE